MSLVHPEPNSGCWLWDSTLNRKGYGIFWNGHKRMTAHRFSYEMHKGPMPDGLETDHKCRVRCCVNPDHLEAVTNTVNMARAKIHRTACKRGHPFTPENTRLKPIGPWVSRHCIACDVLRTETGRSGRKRARKITDDQVLALREQRSAGARVIALAAKFGLSHGHVSRIANGHERKRAILAAAGGGSSIC